MKRIYLIPILNAIVVAVIITLAINCSTETSIKQARTKAEKLFQKELAKDNVHNAILTVYSPSLSIDWDFAGGKFQDGKTINSENPFYTASIGKTFTATAIAILYEQGKLEFDDKIVNYLPDSITENLHVFNGKDYSGEITVAQLLQHTSGLPDYFEGRTKDGSENVIELLFSNPEKVWTPQETIELSKLKMEPLFTPGTDYNYSDTEYVLLGLIIEQISGMPLHDFFRKHIFEPLGMNNIWMYFRSEPIERTAKLTEFYAGDFEASTMHSLTADWAGGGLASTTKDLIKFQQALFSGKIVSNETLEKMQSWVPETRGMEYGFGLRKISFKKLFPLLPVLIIIGHSGSTGSFMFYCPELDVYLAGTLNQTDEIKNSVVLMVKVLSIINKIVNLGNQN